MKHKHTLDYNRRLPSISCLSRLPGGGSIYGGGTWSFYLGGGGEWRQRVLTFSEAVGAVDGG